MNDDRTPSKEDLEEDSPEMISLINATESTVPTSDAPESKTSETSSLILLLMDDPTYIAPNQQDMLFLDISANNYLHRDLSTRTGMPYLSVVPQADEELERYQKTRTVHGTIIGTNKRFMVKVPCRQYTSNRNRKYPTSPKQAALPFHNVFHGGHWFAVFLPVLGSHFPFGRRQ
jgi:hypothetical protein